jgi:hypothetical protein
MTAAKLRVLSIFTKPAVSLFHITKREHIRIRPGYNTDFKNGHLSPFSTIERTLRRHVATHAELVDRVVRDRTVGDVPRTV